MKKILSLFIFVICLTTNLFAYSYASAGQEPTLDAEDAILNAINENDFKKANDIFEKYSKNYKYLNDEFNDKIYDGLKTSIDNKDKKNIVKWLRVSLALEIERRLDGALKNIDKFNIAKVMMAKANKFYKLLSSNLDFKTNKTLKKALKKCTQSIGNPGLFGVGAKPKNLEVYKKNQEIALSALKSL